MSKSNKKVKSERINALRKQYDAFLEEDKLRKDRNCFILEKLDKMRFSSAAVQLRDRRNIYLDRKSEDCNTIGKQIGNCVDYSFQSNCQSTPDVPKEFLDESLMIQEISRKYILIPKTKSTAFSDYAPTIKCITNDSSDWKHKYEILNRLKKNELDLQIKGCEKDNYYFEDNQSKEELHKFNDNGTNRSDKYKAQLDAKDDLLNEELKRDRIDDNLIKSLHDFKNNEVQEEVNKIPTSLTYYDNNELIKQNLGNSPFEPPEIKQCVSNDDTLTNVIPNGKLDHDNYSRKSTQNENEIGFTIENDYTKMDSKNLIPSEPVIVSEHHASGQENEAKDIPNITYLEKDDVNSVQEINSNDFMNEIVNDIPMENVKGHDDVQYPIAVTNVQEIPPKNNIQLQDSTNINPEGYINNETIDSSYQNDPGYVINQGIVDSTYHNELQAENIAENSDNPEVTSGIEAFDAEQRELFYSEPQESYTYDHSDDTGNKYNQEYANNENYQQNPEYYDGVQMEHPYPAEINEHEETSQRYDQNYEEQYSSHEQEKYEQQEYEEPQQYEEPQVDNILQPEIDQLQYEQLNYETQEHVEGHLDHEQGLIENKFDEMQVENPQFEDKQGKQVDD